eukprot:7096552-Prymnesium_polylepis.2
MHAAAMSLYHVGNQRTVAAARPRKVFGARHEGEVCVGLAVESQGCCQAAFAERADDPARIRRADRSGEWHTSGAAAHHELRVAQHDGMRDSAGQVELLVKGTRVQVSHRSTEHLVGHAATIKPVVRRHRRHPVPVADDVSD